MKGCCTPPAEGGAGSRATSGFVAKSENERANRLVNLPATRFTMGNDSADADDPDVINYPAGFDIPGVISVASTDNNDVLSGYSNWGAESITLAAPGSW